jgi:ABC-type multidrug transport system permease subunit
VDPEGSIVSDSLASILGGMNGMGEVFRDDLDTARGRLSRNEILMVLQFPAGFFDLTQQLAKRPPITLWLNERMPAETAIFLRALLSVADSIAGMQAAYMAFTEAIQPLFPDQVSYDRQLARTFSQVAVWALTRRGVLTMDEGARLNTTNHVLSSIVCLLTMQTGLLLLSQAADERRNGVSRRLLLGGVPWFLSPVARAVVGVLWAGVAFAPLFIGLKVVFPESRPDVMLLGAMMLYWVTALLCQAVGYATGGGSLALPGAFLGILALLLLGGCIYPQTILPAFLRPLMPVSPAWHAYNALYAGLTGEGLPQGTWIAFGAMLVVSGAALWQAGRHGLRAGAGRAAG